MRQRVARLGEIKMQKNNCLKAMESDKEQPVTEGYLTLERREPHWVTSVYLWLFL